VCEFLDKDFNFISVGNDLHHVLTQNFAHKEALIAATEKATGRPGKKVHNDGFCCLDCAHSRLDQISLILGFRRLVTGPRASAPCPSARAKTPGTTIRARPATPSRRRCTSWSSRGTSSSRSRAKSSRRPCGGTCPSLVSSSTGVPFLGSLGSCAQALSVLSVETHRQCEPDRRRAARALRL
jgi:hypothetical protein